MLNTLKKFRNYYILLLSLVIYWLTAIPAKAWSFLEAVPGCVSSGDCSPCDLIKVMVTIGKFVMGISGSLALLMFVYGGFLWIVSGGNKDRITKGKTIFVQSTIGLAIVMFAYVLISGLIALFKSTEFGNWSAIC